MPRGKRTRIAPGLYQDDLGFAGVAHAGGRRRERRFPAGTALKTMRAWQDDTRRELREAAADTAAALPAGTLAADVATALLQVPASQRAELRYLVGHWLAALGHRARASLTPADLRAVEATWTTAAPSSVRHRRRALTTVWRLLDGPDADCPVARLPRIRQRLPAIRAIDFALAEHVIAGLPDRGRPRKGEALTSRDRSKSRARLRVMLYTGLPPATLRRIRPQDVELERGVVVVPPRRKGAGAPAAVLPLLPQAIEAFRDWLRVGAWGAFSSHSLAKTFRRAVRRARLTRPEIPADLRVYDLRHSFLSMMLEATGDLAAVRELGQHASVQTTLRYTQRAASPRASAAIESVARQRGTAAGEGRNT